MMKLVLVVGCIASVVCAVPSFPDSWSAQTVAGIAIFQGGEKRSDGSVCCDDTAPSCKIQTATQTATTFNDGENNRTRTDGPSGSIVNWYGTVNKQMQIEPNPSGKGYTCVAACPIEGEYSNPLTIGSTAKDSGSVTINNKPAEKWVFYDTLLKIIRMEEIDFYVDQSAKDPSPVTVIEKITPFDIPIIHPTKELGESATNYSNFSSAALDPETFDIANCSAKHCHCPKPQNGCKSNQDFQSAVYARARIAPPQTLLDLLPQKGSAQSDVTGAAAEAAGVWANDWSATEAAIMVINQGAVRTGDAYCCRPSETASCQVQLSTGGGTRYMDHSNQRTRIEEVSGAIGVDDFKGLKSMAVVHNGTHDVCKSYCPIDKEDTLDAGAAYFLDDKAKDLGRTMFEGRKVNEWQWKELLLKIFTVSTTNFYASVDEQNNVTPVAQSQTLAPFGPPLGTSNMTWSAFKPGKQPAEKFAIVGEESCPQDSQCGSPQWQLKRLAARQYHSFARYQQIQL